MDLKLLEVLTGVVGIAGLGIGVLFLIYRQLLQTKVLEPIGGPKTFALLRLIAILTFVIALLSIVAYVWLQFVDRGPPLDERQRNFASKVSDLAAFEDYSFDMISSRVVAIADTAEREASSTDKDFWKTLGSDYTKYGTRLNRAYSDLSNCFSSRNCALQDPEGPQFCSRVSTYSKRVAETDAIFGKLQVGLTIAQPGTDPVDADGAVFLPPSENLRNLVGYCIS